MTTAHRPTFAPAQGKAQGKTEQYSSRDATILPLKHRQPGQGTEEEVSQKKDLKRDLERKERVHSEKKHRDHGPADKEDEREEKRLKIQPNPQDADDSDSEEESGSGSDSEGEDDSTLELMRELEKIKQEREEERERREREVTKAEEWIRTEQVLGGNPLINQATDYSLKKKWYDDVVFKNCAKTEAKPQKRFINDTIRTDFHRKFLMRYIK